MYLTLSDKLYFQKFLTTCETELLPDFKHMGTDAHKGSDKAIQFHNKYMWVSLTINVPIFTIIANKIPANRHVHTFQK